MGTSDLIRLAQELAECGGVHRLTALINAAVHVTLEHERRGEETGVGMSDKVALAGTGAPIDPHGILPTSIRGNSWIGGSQSQTYLGIYNPVPIMTLNGERKPLRPQDDFGRLVPPLKDPEEWR